MVKHNLISDSDFSQDGTKVKANAGNNSFRREDSLKNLEIKATEYLNDLKREERASNEAYEKIKLQEKIRRTTE